MSRPAHQHIKMPVEPDLSLMVEMVSDRLFIRNIIYTAWSVFNSGQRDAYSKWEVQKMADGRGYLLLFHFCKGFHIALTDMLTLQDASPLRIDSMFVKEQQETFSEHTSTAILLCLCILNSDQPVQLTETDVVRIRKRSRGLLGTARDLFTGNWKKS